MSNISKERASQDTTVSVLREEIQSVKYDRVMQLLLAVKVLKL